MKTTFTSLLTFLCIYSYAQPGSPVSGFGTSGKASANVGTSSQSRAIAVQTDGKIIVAGNYNPASGGTNFALVRYTATGSLDPAFSGDGIVTTAIANYEFINAVTVQTDGKIIAVGYGFNGSAYQSIITRYTADGTLDASFSGDGIYTVGAYTSANDVAIQTDGKIVVALSSGAGAILRLNTDGTPDTSFDGDGIASLPAGYTVKAIALQSDGKIVVGGQGAGQFMVARYTSNGLPDGTFDGDGFVSTTINASGNSQVYSLAIHADGRIVAVGEYSYLDMSDMTAHDAALARYNSSGTLDATFDGDGKKTITTGFASMMKANSVAVQNSDGKIVVTGEAMGLVRLNGNGTYDVSFSGDGKVGEGTLDGAAVELSGNRIYVTTRENAFPLYAYQNDVNVSLPLTITNFTVTSKMGSVYLAWKTASEQNTARFEVERSADGKLFTAIGTVAASGYSTEGKTYSLSDDRPLLNLNYYRLKAIDNDGRFRYSQVVLMKLNNRSELEIYPNPAQNTVQLQFTASGKPVTIYDLAGRMVKTLVVNQTGRVSTVLDISELEKGVYILKAGSEAVQLIKQ